MTGKEIAVRIELACIQTLEKYALLQMIGGAKVKENIKNANNIINDAADKYQIKSGVLFNITGIGKRTKVNK